MANANASLDNEYGPRTPRPKRNRILRLAGWTAACLGAIVVLCVAAVFYLVNTSAGHRFLLILAQRKATEALGVNVQLQNFILHPGSLSLDLYGIRVSGAAPYPNPPLFQADRAEVSLRVVSVLRAKWYFDTIEMDHPVAWIVVDNKGRSNLPVIKSSGSSHTDIFDLGIRHFHIGRGEVYYNSRPSTITADLDDLEFESAFTSSLTRYSGRLAYSNGRIVFGSFRPLEHNLDAEFEATRNLFTLKSGNLTAGASRATLSGMLRNYSNPNLQAQYQIVLDGSQAAHTLNDPELPAGIVNTSGTLQYQQSPNRTLVESLIVDGRLSSARLFVNTRAVRIGASNLVAHYSLANGNAVLRDLRFDVLGGAIAAEGSIQQIGGNSHSSFRLACQKASLAQVRQALAQSTLSDGISLDGTASATATAEWGKTIDSLIARADLTLDGKASRPQPLRAPAGGAQTAVENRSVKVVPLQGVIHAIYSNSARSLALDNSYIRSSQSKIALNGAVSRNSSLAVNLQANDLSEIATIVDLFHAAAPGGGNLDLRGQASFQGTVRGSMDAPDLTGQLTAENLVYNGTNWKSLRTGLELSPAHASLENFRLEAMKQGNVTASAAVGLQHWSPSTKSPIQLELNASGLSMETIAMLTGRQLPLSGILTASAHLHGEIENPTGNASVTLTGTKVSDEPISRANVDLSGSGSQVQISASALLPSGTVQARMTADPRARTFTAQLQSTGIDLAKLQTIRARDIGAIGMVQLQAQGRGVSTIRQSRRT